MTTKNLIGRLRDTASKGVSVWGDLQMEAAKEIETLMAERECYASAMDRMQAALAEPSEAVYIRRDQLQKARRQAYLCEVGPEPREDKVAVFTHPAPSKPAPLPELKEALKEIERLTALCQEYRENGDRLMRVADEYKAEIERLTAELADAEATVELSGAECERHIQEVDASREAIEQRDAEIERLTAERDAKLAALANQEPYGYWWTPDGTYDIGQEPVMSQNTGPCTGWTITPLYAAAGAAPVPEGWQPEPVGHLYTIAGVQHCTITKELPDCALYAHPPTVRETLSDAEIDDLLVKHGKGDDGFHAFARAIEAKIGAKP